MRFRRLPLTLQKQINYLRLVLGFLFLRAAEWIELRTPPWAAAFLLRTTALTFLILALLPAHPMRFTAALGISLSAGVIVRSFEVVIDKN